MSPCLRNRHQEDCSLANVMIGNGCNYRNLLAYTVMHDTRYVSAAITVDNQ